MAFRIHIKRAYDPEDAKDGFRVFVDRLWPRGLSKEEFQFDLWPKDLAPSAALRKWFGHKVENWEKFQKDYQKELRTPEQIARIQEVLGAANGKPITLLYGAKDTEHNQAVVLAKEIGIVKNKS